MTTENLGAAERLIQALTTYADHMVHNRPGIVVEDTRTPIGVKWQPGSLKEEGGKKNFYRHDKVQAKKGKAGTRRVLIGSLWADGTIRDEGRHKLGRYQKPGLFEEVAVWMYRQVAEIWKIDNEFAARWASYAFRRDDTPRDLLVILAAFMLVQSRFGEPVLDDDGKFAFRDEDYREIGEAMCLIYGKKLKGFDAKQLLRVLTVLRNEKIADINRELGFGRSARRPALGRYEKAVTQWLRYREQNPQLLDGLVKAGNRNNVMRLCQSVGYKPDTPKFFETLRWKQEQAEDGRREFIDTKVLKTETWDGLTEAQICEKIVGDRLGFKQVVGRLPKEVGLTRAIMAASIDAGGLSRSDLVTYTPTLESLGLLEVQTYREKWEAALQAANDQRAAHIAERVQKKETQEKLETAADNAVTRAVEEEVRGLDVYVIVDRSASMDEAIILAKDYVTKLLAGFPPENVHVSVFSQVGRVVEIKHASRAGVQNAFKGITAAGGTNYGEGLMAFTRAGILPKEGNDALVLWLGDEEQNGTFERVVEASGINPVAFGLVRLFSERFHRGVSREQHIAHFNTVRATAQRLGIPCFEVTEGTFSDAYAVPRILRNLIAATPVRQDVARPVPKRETLVEIVQKTDLLQKPAWAYAPAG